MTPAARERARVRTPILLASACGWVLLFLLPDGAAHGAHGATLQGHTASHDHAALHGQATLHGGTALHAQHHASSSALLDLPIASLAAGWALMLVAMMLPLLSPPVRHVLQRSLLERRARSVALFLMGYAGLWMAAGAPLIAGGLAVQSSASPLAAAGLAALGVLLWQVSPLKQVCLNRLHGHPALAAFGFAADVDALRFGLWHGLWCIGSCFGLMLLPMLFPSAHLPLMVLVSLWMWGEQLERPALPSWRWRAPLKGPRLIVAQLQQRVRAQRSAPLARHTARS